MAGTIGCDLVDPAVATSLGPHETQEDWEALRESPVTWFPGAGGARGHWAVARYADLVACYRNAAAFGSGRGTTLEILARGQDSAGGRMLAVSDGAFHRELKQAVARYFTADALARIDTRIRARTDELVAQHVGAGAFEFCEAVAESVPIGTICDLLGVPEADRRAFLSWNKESMADPDESADPVAARTQILCYLMDLAEERRRSPTDDVVSALVATTLSSGSLSLETVALNCYSLILGGDESSRLASSSAMFALSGAGGELARLRSGEVDPDLAVEELLRWASPSRHFARSAEQDVRIGDQIVPAGSIVTLWNVAGNFDPRQFEDPLRLDLARRPNRHLSLGHGKHYCLGAVLGRMGLRALVETLRERVSSIELAGRPRWVRSNFVNGVEQLPLVLR